MADQPRPDDLAPIYARLAAQDAEIARLTRHRQLLRRALPLLLAALLVALVPLATLAANPFVDLNPNSVHNADIDAIYNAGITKGCDPGVAYCPNANVTREEMASFLARTAGLGGNPPVANAKLINGQTADSLLRAGRGEQGPAPLAVAGGEWQTVAEVVVIGPGPGYALVNAAVDLTTVAGPANGAQVRLHSPETFGDRTSPPLGVATPAGAAQSYAPTYLFTILISGPRTYQLQVRADAGSTYSAANGTITALYVAFGADGKAP